MLIGAHPGKFPLHHSLTNYNKLRDWTRDLRPLWSIPTIRRFVTECIYNSDLSKDILEGERVPGWKDAVKAAMRPGGKPAQKAGLSSTMPVPIEFETRWDKEANTKARDDYAKKINPNYEKEKAKSPDRNVEQVKCHKCQGPHKSPKCKEKFIECQKCINFGGQYAYLTLRRNARRCKRIHVQ